jgi:hypothetical protein
MSNPAIRLIVNADDFGYFPCVSRGIAQAAQLGAVNATGILANGPQLAAQIGWLGEYEALDLGVHLNLTSGAPLAAEMADYLAGSGGQFPGAFAMARHVLSRKIPLQAVRAEWRAQIEAVLRLGVAVRFLNSHEHIHMLPGLFGLARALAAEYEVAHLRLTRAEWLPPFGFSASLRNLVLQSLESVHRLGGAADSPVFIGLGGSGKLSLDYLRRLFARLQPGAAYELMCHPGLFDPAEIREPKLLAYHAWEAELAVLTGPQIQDLYAEFGIRLVNYRTLSQETP